MNLDHPAAALLCDPSGQDRLAALRLALASLDPSAFASQWLGTLIDQGFDRLPMPGAGATLQRWEALAAVAAHDLSLAKLYEGHTDAIAILAELGDPAAGVHRASWGVWAAEPPQGRVTLALTAERGWTLTGKKMWCSGAAHVTHGLLTSWYVDGRGPQLVRVAMGQPGVRFDDAAWSAVGMSGSASIDIEFDAVACDPVGDVGDYLSRPGFWHGGAGIAACWYGGAVGLANTLHRALAPLPEASRGPFRNAALGKVDVSLQRTAALLRDAAQRIDALPRADASTLALRCRLAAEETAGDVVATASRALGAGALCRDAHFARAAADLPVFVRQSHGERDCAALGERVAAASESAWML